jgi:spore coat protein H
MFRKLKIFGFILLLITASSCFEEIVIFDSEPSLDLQLPLILKFDHINCSYDAEMEILRYYLPQDSLSDFSPFIEFQESSELFINTRKVENNKLNPLGLVQINQAYNIQIRNGKTTKQLDLIFTNLPIIQIISDTKIYDEPKSIARIQINSSEKNHHFTSFAGIELRGRYSRDYDKKSMGFALWEGMDRSLEYSSELLGLKKNSDWILGAAFIDPSRIRNLVSFEIWNGLNNLGSYHLGIQSRLIEVFLNNSFQGIYVFSELLNEQLLGVDNNAVLYKGIEWANGATKFESFNPGISINQFWNGWEQKIPDRKERINWSPLNNLYELVVNASDEDFAANIANHFNIDNLIDYYLFLNLTLAIDNTGKNCFLFAKNDDTPLQYIPWDLDGSWGILYDGTRVDYKSILTNNLFNRLYETDANNYKLNVKTRWFYLRNNNFERERIVAVFDKYFKLMKASDIIQKENLIWDINLNILEEQAYIKYWATDRLEFLDNYFEGF